LLPASGRVNGVDVSNWQGSINWTAVANSGVRVAYLKAAEGTSYNDPTYAANRRNANAAGVAVGAYDFARPGTSGGARANARAEAQHFLAAANVHASDLLPALDLEETGGLSPAQLGQWVDSWLQTVAAATGVNPAIYVSPSFWNDNVQDTEGIAKRTPLWVANWGVSSPAVPGAWQSWSGWQYSSSGSVPGISGNVDQDRYRNPASLVVANARN
jgi:GH25 family lysozyme M1 (1,4-beta-N-acetylmuramidase)